VPIFWEKKGEMKSAGKIKFHTIWKPKDGGDFEEKPDSPLLKE